MDIDDVEFTFTVDCKSHRGKARFYEELSAIAGGTVQTTFGLEGTTYRIVNCYGSQHKKEIQCASNSPALEWARNNRKRIKPYTFGIGRLGA